MATIDRREKIPGWIQYLSYRSSGQAKDREEYTAEWGSSQAHTEYLARIYSDRSLKDYKRAKQGFQKDLRHGRRWSILIDGFITEDGNTVPGLGLGILLLCGPATARKMLSARLCKEYLLTSMLDITLQNIAIPM